MGTIPRQPDCRLEGDLVTIEPLRTGDLAEMLAWERFDDPLLDDYNVPFETLASGERWLRRRLTERWAYGIRNGQQKLVGHLSLRQLDLPWTSRLGITLAPPHVGQGYGRDSLDVFIDYYFRELQVAEMRLDVSALNPRAVRLYRTLGFVTEGSFWRQAPWGLDRQQADPQHLRRGKIRFYEMRLLAREWVERSAARA